MSRRQLRTAGSACGPRPGCGAGCTGRYWTSSAPEAIWTGRPRSSTPRRYELKGGLADRTESGRSWQERQQTACVVRGPGPAAGRRGVGGEHARQSGVQAAHPGHTRCPIPARTPSAAAGEDPCGQGLSLRRAPALAPQPEPHPTDRPPRHRVRRAARTAPLEDRAVDLLALRIPPPHRPVLAKRQPLPRLPRPRSSPHLLQEARETHHVRHPLRASVSTVLNWSAS